MHKNASLLHESDVTTSELNRIVVIRNIGHNLRRT